MDGVSKHTQVRPTHELAGKIVLLKSADSDLNGKEYAVEDWWINVTGKSWMDCSGNPGAINYAIRGGLQRLPTDNEVVYGKIGPYGYLVHVSELGEVVS